MRLSPKSLFYFLIPLSFLFACAKTPPKSSERLREIAPPPQFHSLSSFVQVRIEARGKMDSFDAALLIQAPDKMRIEILDDLGQVVSRLVADGSELLWYDPQAEEYSKISQEKNSLKKFFRLPISVEDFIQGMLIGSLKVEKSRYLVRYGPAWSTQNPYPKEILWEFSRPKVRLNLTMQDPVTDAALALDKFDTTPPPGARPGKIH